MYSFYSRIALLARVFATGWYCDKTAEQFQLVFRTDPSFSLSCAVLKGIVQAIFKNKVTVLLDFSKFATEHPPSPCAIIQTTIVSLFVDNTCRRRT